MKTFYTAICACIFTAVGTNLTGQLYTDYIGAGHHQGITITASSSMNSKTTPFKTLDGSGMDSKFMAASRFLAQAAVSYDTLEIQKVMNMGYEAWIDDQLAEPTSLLLPLMDTIWYEVKVNAADEGQDSSELFGPWGLEYNYTMFTRAITAKDQLRHRVAQALSEILVISMNSDLRDWGEAVCSYYDILSTNAFGNYHDLLSDVTKSVPMGYYLSHINNPKTDTVNNIRPDENYAREIMQLFTIGLYELNPDGTPKRDANGNQIPTYDNDDIKELAKVFTGLGAGAIENPNNWPFVPIFGVGMWAIDKTVPMQMFQNHHEPGPKVLLKDVTIDIPGDGMAEIDAAVDYLFNHPNVGPFIAYRLIQRLVASNPSPAYVARVAAVFDDDGFGERGNLAAVIKAILLDEEAREGMYMEADYAGSLRAPFLRYTQWVGLAELYNPNNRFWNHGFNFNDNFLHWPLHAPTVFNFYLPNYQPVGPIGQAGLVSPEMKLHNTSNAIGLINFIHSVFYWDGHPWWDWEPGEPNDVHVLITYLQSIADDPEKMINVLDRTHTRGQLTHEMREIMRTVLASIHSGNHGDWQEYRTRMLLYLFMISPDYNVLK